jgi:hypothetical protein
VAGRGARAATYAHAGSWLWHGTREKELSNPFYHWVVQGFEDVGLEPGLNITLDHQFADESDARYNVLAPALS